MNRLYKAMLAGDLTENISIIYFVRNMQNNDIQA